MACLLSFSCTHSVSSMGLFYRPEEAAFGRYALKRFGVVFMAQCGTRIYSRNLPKNLRYPRRAKLPPEFGVNTFLKKEKKKETDPTSITDLSQNLPPGDCYDTETNEDGDIIWNPDEIEAISSLFRGRIPQKPGKLNRERPLPLPLPHKIRPLGLPTPKRRPRTDSRQTMSKKVYKNPTFLVNIAKEIRSLPTEEDVSTVLNKWAPFFRKGSLSLTIRELGHMGFPERALQTFCWAKKQPLLFPDDRILASTVEVLARNHELEIPSDLHTFITLASRSVIEAMVKGFIKGGRLKLARKLLSVAKDGKRMLDCSIYAKLVLELGKNPDQHIMVSALLQELGERDDFNLSQQDCTAIMKVCIRFGKYETVDSLFNWFKQSGHDPNVVMYTTVIYSLFSENRHREAVALVWELESLNCLFDLPAYRVVIQLFVALNDLPRTVRYFSKLKEAGFSPTYDIYRELFTIYKAFGRLSKCKEVCKEAETAGFLLDKEIKSWLLQHQE